MTDVHSTSIRSKNMRAIRHRDTKPELLIRKALHKRGFRYRLNVKKLPGTPDIVLPKYRALIFVHGCFWHGHQCHLFKIPKTRTDFWLTKIENNLKRDIISQKNLCAGDWRVAVVWECALKGQHKLSFEALINELSNWIVNPRVQNVEFQGTVIERVSDT
ncbi:MULTISPECIES: very short patch repair endonuclease [Oxalobacteraceae]|uniref:very short patch repair endonuclease n=1 Tax=Herminiimonas sp. Marseille-P9896 TaxID=2742211 RepID=UPI00158CAA88|nr:MULTISPECIES: DNA mismatch endonuclease Vsr [Oxalobacteraceae]